MAQTGRERTDGRHSEFRTCTFALRMTQQAKVDGGEETMDPALMAELGQAIKEAIRHAGTSANQLANAIDVDAGQISRIINGRSQAVTVERVVQIERQLGLERGYIFRAAGLVAEEVGVKEAIAADRTLPEKARELLLNIYETFLNNSSGSSGPTIAVTAKTRKR